MTPILEYHRPTTLNAALALLGRPSPRTRPLAGGAHYRRGIKWPEALVDLSALGLDGIRRTDAGWEFGATVTLEAVAAHEDLPTVLRHAARRQAPRNFRQRATLGGCIATRDTGALAVCFLGMNGRMKLEPGGRWVSLLSYAQTRVTSGDLITSIVLPANRAVGYAEISRSPADLPIVCVGVGAERAAGSRAPTNFTVAATGVDQGIVLLGGVAQLLDGAPEADAETVAAVLPRPDWNEDGRGTAEYRNAMLPVLIQRAVADLLNGLEA